MKQVKVVPNLHAMMVYLSALKSTLKQIPRYDEIPRNKYPFPTAYRLAGTSVRSFADDMDFYFFFKRGKLPLDSSKFASLNGALAPAKIEVVYRPRGARVYKDEEYDYAFVRKGAPMRNIEKHMVCWLGFMREHEEGADFIDLHLNTLKDTAEAEKIMHAVLGNALGIIRPE